MSAQQLEAWIEFCPGCGGDDDDHCTDPECASHIAVHCHRAHYEEPIAGALMLPVLLRVPWYGSRN